MPTWTPTAILERLFKVDPQVARVILIGLSVLAAVVIVGNWGLDTGSILPIVMWLAGCYVLFVFLANMPGWLGTFLGSAACLGFVAYVALFAVQLVTQNTFNPPVMVAGCFFSPAQQGCPMNVLPPSERGTIDVAAPGPAERPTPPGGSSAITASDTTAPDTTASNTALPPPIVVQPEETGGEAELPAAPDLDFSQYRVFVQYFSRRIPEDQARALASGLSSEGWTVSPDVEALSSAYGVNEVRYFHPEDAEAAQMLAAEVPGAAPWEVQMRVRDFTHVAGAPSGLLEVWVGG